MNWINENGNLFSFLGLIITILTFLGVIWSRKALNRLNIKNFKINRMPENLFDLKTISDNLSDLIIQFDSNKKGIKLELSKIQPILKSLNKSLNEDEIENFEALMKSLKHIDNWKYEGEKISFFKNLFRNEKEMTENMINEIDIKLTRLITDIDNIERDNKKNLL